MAEHLLDGAQIARRLQDMRRKRVAQGVRVHALADALAHCQLLQARPGPRAARCVAPRIPMKEYAGIARQARSQRQPGGEGLQSLGADRDDALLAALAGDAHLAGLPVDVLRRQSDQFGEAQARGIGQLEHGPVAHLPGIIAGIVEQLGELIGREAVRQAPGRLGGTDAGAGIGRYQAFARQVAKQATPGGHHARQAFRRITPAMQGRQGTADVVAAERIRLGRADEFAQVTQVLGVGGQGVGTVMARPQGVQIAVDPELQGGHWKRDAAAAVSSPSQLRYSVPISG
jgi:hypothetical protein